MKIATFNIQNLFHRHSELVEMEQETKSEIWREEFDSPFFKENKIHKDYNRMRELANLLGFHKPLYKPYLSMQNFDGNLNIKSSMKEMETKASYLTDWNGGSKLWPIPITKNAIANKAKVILDINPDIILLQEVENRDSLIQFNKSFFKERQKSSYNEIIHLQGNDSKGLGMAILLKEGYQIKSVKSYSNERDTRGKLLFNTDFQKYKIQTPNKETLFLLSCHLVDGYKSDLQRKKQAKKVAEVYNQLISKGQKNIIIAGTLNASSYSDSISPIMETAVEDVVKHNSFSVVSDSGKDAKYFRMGAYRMGVNIKQKDYLLLSPALFDQVKESGMNRKAFWPLKKPEWEIYESIQNEKDSASDHPLLWADFRVEDTLRLFKKSA